MIRKTGSSIFLNFLPDIFLKTGQKYLLKHRMLLNISFPILDSLPLIMKILILVRNDIDLRNYFEVMQYQNKVE